MKTFIVRGLPLVVRILLMVATTGLAPAARAQNQVVPFPTWYRDWLNDRGNHWAQQIPPIYAACHESMRSDLRSHTARPTIGPYRFFASAPEGVVAVFRKDSFAERSPECGLDTGFTNVLALDVAPPPSWLAPSQGLLVVTGIKPNGRCGFKGFVVAPDAPIAAATPVDIPIESPPGKAYISASLVNDMLYVLEGTEPKIVRFVDTSGDHVPDALDSTFGLSMAGPGSWRTYVFAFRPAENAVVKLEHAPASGHQPRTQRFIVETTPGNFQLQVGASPLASSASAVLPVFRSEPVHGQDRIEVQGLRNRPSVIEAATTPNGPWSQLSGTVVFTADGAVQVVELSRPLTFGERVRIRPVGSAGTSSYREVGEERLRIFQPLHQSAMSGAPLSVLGDNLHGAVSATFFDAMTRTTVTLTIGSQDKHHVDLLMPQIGSSPRFGIINIAKEGVVEGVTTVIQPTQ